MKLIIRTLIDYIVAKGDEAIQLKTIKRAFDVIRALEELDGAGVTELAEHQDMPPSTVHKYLDSLLQERVLVKEGTEYHLGVEFLHFGGFAKNRKLVYQIASQKVGELAEETRERAQFVVEEHGRGIYVETESKDRHAVQINRRIGSRRYLHSSAAGKAILAHLPEDRREEIIRQWGLPEETENTITSDEELAAELAAIRERKIAFNDEESVAGLRAVGVPILSADGDVFGALSISAPTQRLKGKRYREELPELLLGYANEIELTITYS